jgi:1-acyl-sn-glycerol-3-phosphate acyltransferase
VAAAFTVGARVPRRRHAVLRFIGRALLRLLGWRIEGDIPDLPRFVVAVAPHTSNWDFVIGMAAMFVLELRLSFLGKHTLFRGPLGAVLRAMGGIPVDRAASRGVVRSAVEAFGAHAQLILAIAPEGTRSPVARLRSGFAHIAREAGVPILLATLDGATRTVRLGPVVDASGDAQAVVARVEGFYRGVRGWREKPFPAPAKEAPPG